MKIGIITIQKCNNFGADLQAFALQKKLQLMGYDAENIDYVFYKNSRHLKGRGEKPVLRLSVANRIKEALFPILDPVRNFKNRREMGERGQRLVEEKYVWDAVVKNIITGYESITRPRAIS